MAFSSFNSIQTFIRYVSTSVSSFLFPSVDPSLVLYYPFDVSQNGVKTANYASGQAVYDATFGGNVVITNTTNAFVAGLGDLSLNNVMGSNMATNYVVSGNTFALNSSGLTISFWFACNGVANTLSTAVCLPLNSSGAKLEIDISGSTMIYSNYISSPTLSTFVTTQFRHTVLSISGTIHTLYVDGVQVAQNTNALNLFTSYTTVTNPVIGATPNLTQAFRGNIDDLRVYNYAIQASKVADLYLNRNLAVYYPFDTSANGQIPNYGTLTYDASFVGTANTTASSLVGNAALSLTNTAGVAATNYVSAIPNIPFIPSNGLTISFWVNTTGVSNRIMRLFDIPALSGQKGLSLDISGTNTIYSSYKSLFAFSTGYSCNSGMMDFSGNFMYVPNYFTNTIVQTNLTTGQIVNASFISTSTAFPVQCIIYNNILYVLNLASSGTSGYISTYNLSTGAVINAALITVNTFVNFFKIYGGFIYISNAGQVIQYNLSTGAATGWIVTPLQGVITLDISGNYMYIGQYTNSTVAQINLTTAATVNASWCVLSLPNTLGGVTIYGNNLYISYLNKQTIVKVNLLNGSIVDSTWAYGFGTVFGINTYNNYLYAFDQTTQIIYKLSL